MAFNQIRYDISSFNIDTGNARFITGTGVESVASAIGTNLMAYLDAIGNEKVTEKASGAAGRFPFVSGTETISEGVADGQNMIVLAVSFQERVTKKAVISAYDYVVAAGSEAVTKDITIGHYTKPVAIGAETIDDAVSIGQAVKPVAVGYEFVAESANLEAIDFKTCYIGSAQQPFNLLPGQKLVIDADNYNVLVDGENAIHLQSGDWIDELNLETVSIAVTASAGSSNLTASILYTEKYL